MAENENEKNLDRRSFMRLIAITGGSLAVAGIAGIALGTGGGAAGAGGGAAGPGGYSNGWCSFWHDEQDPTYGSSALNGTNPQGWDRTSAERQLERLNKMVSLDYTGSIDGGLVALGDSPNTPSNELVDTYYNVAQLALDKAKQRASDQRGVTVNHARVIGVGIRYMITDWRPGTYGRDGMATATFTELFDKREMWPSTMSGTSHGAAGGLREESGWGQASDIYGYAVAQGYATNRDGEWQRAMDDVPGDWTLIVVAVAEDEPISFGKVTIKKVLNGDATNQQFQFHITATSNGSTVKNEDFYLKHNQTKTYELPPDSHYEINEVAPHGFKLMSMTNASGTVEGGQEVTVVATNQQLTYMTLEKGVTL